MLKPVSAATLLTISLTALPIHGSTQSISGNVNVTAGSQQVSAVTEFSLPNSDLPVTNSERGNFAPPSIGGNAAFVYPLVTTYGGGR